MSAHISTHIKPHTEGSYNTPACSMHSCVHIYIQATRFISSVRAFLFWFYFLLFFFYSFFVRCSSIRCERVCGGFVCAMVWVMVWVRDSTENRLFKFNARRKRQTVRRAGRGGMVFNFGIRVNWETGGRWWNGRGKRGGTRYGEGDNIHNVRSKRTGRRTRQPRCSQRCSAYITIAYTYIHIHAR